MVEEYFSIMKNDVWEIVSRPKGKSVVGSRWVYNVKHGADGSVEKYNASQPIESVQWVAVKHVLRYLRGTTDYVLLYKQVDGVRLEGFIDADWAGCSIDRKSTSSGVFSIWSTTVSWYNEKQRSVALSSVEAEYMFASLAECEAIWMRKLLVGLFRQRMESTVIHCDN
eukprot:PITA_14365